MFICPICLLSPELLQLPFRTLMTSCLILGPFPNTWVLSRSIKKKVNFLVFQHSFSLIWTSAKRTYLKPAWNSDNYYALRLSYMSKCHSFMTSNKLPNISSDLIIIIVFYRKFSFYFFTRFGYLSSRWSTYRRGVGLFISIVDFHYGLCNLNKCLFTLLCINLYLKNQNWRELLTYN